MNKKYKIAILIPAHNEEKVIRKTLISVLTIIPKEHIYVVSDGSTDNTSAIARSYIENVITLPHGMGKAKATNFTIGCFDLTNRYEFLMPVDADTIITEDFIKNALPILEKDIQKKIACVVGKVTGTGHNWITAFRIWEYEIAQTIHKTAQSIEDSIMICPGCATIFRSGIFKHITIPSGTLTEDMDLTFLIHRKKLGKIVYIGSSKVITQDPMTFRDYRKQLHRWYTGFWQCLIKHNIPWGGQLLDFEVGIVALEGLFNGLLVLGFVFLVPVVIRVKPFVLGVPASVDLFLFLIPTMAYTGMKNRMSNILLYLPHFYLLRFVSSFIFLLCFIKILFSYDVRMKWHKVIRY